MASTKADVVLLFNVGLVGGPVMTAKVAGIVGLCLTSSLWIIVSWRLLFHSKCWCYREAVVDGVTIKRMLHGLLWATMVVEGVAYALMVGGTDTSHKVTYTLLDIIGFGILEYWTFVVGTAYWFNLIYTARSVGESKFTLLIFPTILVIITLAVTVVSIFEAMDLWNGLYLSVSEFREQSRLYRIALLTESVGWGIHGALVVICGCMVHRRISSLPTISQVRSEARRNIMNKMIIPMVFCALSYFLRSGFLAADFATHVINKSNNTGNFEAGVGWWIGYCWIPTLIPSIMLLYSIRKRDRESPGDGAVYMILQSPNSVGSHEDPFRSFQRTRDYDDGTYESIGSVKPSEIEEHAETEESEEGSSHPTPELTPERNL